jgi:very-short-patch-repair endonuclease
MADNIVRGQHVTEGKVELANRLRREMTLAEKILWERLRRNSFGVHFRRQQIIHGFVADFYCHAVALAIEADGAVHDAAYDAERDAAFESHGIRVLRFKNDDIEKRVGWVLSEIKKAIAQT